MHWKTLHSDADAKFDAEIALDAADIVPMVTWGTSPSRRCRSPPPCRSRRDRRTRRSAPASSAP